MPGTLHTEQRGGLKTEQSRPQQAEGWELGSLEFRGENLQSSRLRVQFFTSTRVRPEVPQSGRYTAG